MKPVAFPLVLSVFVVSTAFADDPVICTYTDQSLRRAILLTRVDLASRRALRVARFNTTLCFLRHCPAHVCAWYCFHKQGSGQSRLMGFCQLLSGFLIR